MAGQEGSEKELWMSGCLVPCTGRHTPVEEEDEEEVVLMSKSMGGGRARPIRVRHGPAAKEEKVTVTGAKRKAERSLKTAAVPSVGWKAAAAPADASRDIAAAAASADASMKAAVDPSAGASMKTATGDGDVEILDAGWVMMPEDHVRWILAQKREKHAVPSIELYDPYRTEGAMELTGFSQKNIDEKRELFSSLHASLVASHKDFFEYQEWVRSAEMDAKLLLPFPSAPAALPAAAPKSLFLGTSLPLHPRAPPPRPFPLRLRPRPAVVVAQAAVKRRKEVPFDNVIQRDKKLKLVLKLRNILVSQPDRVMSLRDLGRFRRDLGLTRKRRLIALLKRFPGVFEVVEEGVYSLKFRLTPAAERLYLDELQLKNESEGLAVTKLRKLLMMSQEKRILLEKIAHLKHDLGLPPEFRDTICLRYPQYFRIVRMDRGPGLELTHWDPELAVSAAEIAEEENRVREAEERNLIIDRPLKFNRVKLPKGLKLTRGEARRIAQFKEIPYISPYSDFSHLRPGSAEKEKHACAVVHEILSLTLEKRTLVDHLTHFREEFRFSQSLRGMIIRHPDMFYVSFKGDRDSVFLREAYKDSQLIEKNKLVLLKEKMRALVAVPRFPRRVLGSTSEEDVGTNGAVHFSDEGSDIEDDDEDEGLSDMEDLISEISGGKSDADYQWGDGWFGENDDSPPDFGDDDSSPQEVKVTMKNADCSTNGRAPVPVFPDGRPRERW